MPFLGPRQSQPVLILADPQTLATTLAVSPGSRVSHPDASAPQVTATNCSSDLSIQAQETTEGLLYFRNAGQRGEGVTEHLLLLNTTKQTLCTKIIGDQS